jgi:hypothetical protein
MEDVMRKLLTVAVVAVVSGSALLAGGCASSESEQPYGLTGETQYPQTWQERQRYTDQKGHYHAEWVGQNGR